MSVTKGSPFVIVPVLSKARIFIRPVSSSAADVLKRMPCLAPTPLPTIIATGVASPSEHGQLTTRTAIPLESAKPRSFPKSSHIRHVKTAIAITAGTNIEATNVMAEIVSLLS